MYRSTTLRAARRSTLPVWVSALVRGKSLNYTDYSEFSFSPPRTVRQENPEGEEENTACKTSA